MPGRFSRRCRAACNETETTSDGVKMHTWLAVRRKHLRKLRKQVRSIVLLMALTEAMRVGPVQIVFAGKDGYPPPGPSDYGIAYNIGYFLSWLYTCLFVVIYTPLFSWWVPESDESDKSSNMAKLADVLKRVNLILLPITTGLCLLQYIYHAICLFIYVDAREVGSRKFPKNNRKNWLIRLLLLCGTLVSMGLGYGAFHILDMTDLAHVKRIEYLAIVVPIQINLGILFASGLQYKIEQRHARKALIAKAAETEAAIAVDEKQALLEH